MLKRLHRVIGTCSVSAFALLAIQSCDDGIIDGENKLIFPEEGEVSYLFNVQPFLNLRCANAGCHGAVAPAAGRALVNYQTVTNPVSNINFVNPFDAESSLFYQIATGVNPHMQNLGLRPLTENQQQGIRRWINDGALNN